MGTPGYPGNIVFIQLYTGYTGEFTCENLLICHIAIYAFFWMLHLSKIFLKKENWMSSWKKSVNYHNIC